MSTEPKLAMADPNFALICSNGSILVNREKLCAFSSVFKDILSMKTDVLEKTCEVSESVEDMMLLTSVIEVTCGETFAWNELKRLTIMAEKYDMKFVTDTVKLNLWTYLSNDTVDVKESYYAAARLKDTALARAAILRGSEPLKPSDECEELWIKKANDFLWGRQKAITKTLTDEAKNLIYEDPNCSKHRDADHFLLKAIVDSGGLPSASQSTPCDRFLDEVKPYEISCEDCHTTVLQVTQNLMEAWPSEERAWRKSF